MSHTTKVTDPRVSKKFVQESTEIVRRKRCFFVQMNGTAEVATPEAHAAAFQSFFLPTFSVGRKCELFGARPGQIAASSQGLFVERAARRWSISAAPTFDGSFPFWAYEPRERVRYTLMLPIPIAAAERELEALLAKAWDPLVLTNPEVVLLSPAYRHAINTARRDDLMWLAYCRSPREMYLAVLSTPEVTVAAYATALRVAKLKFFTGFTTHSEEEEAAAHAPPPVRRRRVPRKYRYTGAIPPANVLRQCPSWAFALDEEGRAGQDETTLRPDEDQDFVSEFAVATTADATFPDGTKCTALLASSFLLCNGVEFVHVYEEGRLWSLQVWDGRWTPSRVMNSEERVRKDQDTFPLEIVSRLECGGGAGRIRLRLFADGTAEEQSGFRQPSLLAHVVSNTKREEDR